MMDGCAGEPELLGSSGAGAGGAGRRTRYVRLSIMVPTVRAVAAAFVWGLRAAISRHPGCAASPPRHGADAAGSSEAAGAFCCAYSCWSESAPAADETLVPEYRATTARLHALAVVIRRTGGRSCEHNDENLERWGGRRQKQHRPKFHQD